MHKTTVYLPDDLHQAVKRLATATGRPVADLIRQAVEQLVGEVPRPRPHGGLFASGDMSLSVRTEELLAGFGER